MPDDDENDQENLQIGQNSSEEDGDSSDEKASPNAPQGKGVNEDDNQNKVRSKQLEKKQKELIAEK